ncbi:hypothetical protein KCV07_g4347, partial [Aureobasidium melanogenum]
MDQNNHNNTTIFRSTDTGNPTSSSETSLFILRPDLHALPFSLIASPNGFPEFSASYPGLEYRVPGARVKHHTHTPNNTKSRSGSLSHLPIHPSNPPPPLHPRLLSPMPNPLANHLCRRPPQHLALLFAPAAHNLPNPLRNPKVQIYMSDVQSKSPVYKTKQTQKEEVEWEGKRQDKFHGYGMKRTQIPHLLRTINFEQLAPRQDDTQAQYQMSATPRKSSKIGYILSRTTAGPFNRCKARVNNSTPALDGHHKDRTW